MSKRPKISSHDDIYSIPRFFSLGPGFRILSIRIRTYPFSHILHLTFASLRCAPIWSVALCHHLLFCFLVGWEERFDLDRSGYYLWRSPLWCLRQFLDGGRSRGGGMGAGACPFVVCSPLYRSVWDIEGWIESCVRYFAAFLFFCGGGVWELEVNVFCRCG